MVPSGVQPLASLSFSESSAVCSASSSISGGVSVPGEVHADPVESRRDHRDVASDSLSVEQADMVGLRHSGSSTTTTGSGDEVAGAGSLRLNLASSAVDDGEDSSSDSFVSA